LDWDIFQKSLLAAGEKVLGRGFFERRYGLQSSRQRRRVYVLQHIFAWRKKVFLTLRAENQKPASERNTENNAQ
jgi:hypothetical protein